MGKDRRSKGKIEKDRILKWIRVQMRWSVRRVRRFLQKLQASQSVLFAKRVAGAVIGVAAVAVLVLVSSAFSHSFLTDEAVLVRRLSDPEFDQSNPVLSALNCFGSTNRIQVTLVTDTVDPLYPEKVHLTRGNINLVMTLKNGDRMEYTLQNRRIDNFESGYTDQFTLILPATVSVFDIAEYKLVLMPDAKGVYGSWHCRSAEISFLLGGERLTVAEEDWKGVFAFHEENPSALLEQVAEEDAYYQQISALYPYVLKICENDRTTVHDRVMKAEALRELGMSEADVLYLDVETVGLEGQNRLLTQMGTQNLEESDRLDYDGTMSLRVQFYSDAAGSYFVDYPLDTPGKDDFELGASSEFALNMPSGMSVFDIRSLELLVHNNRDAWAPRMLRAYLRTDYGLILELARETDVTLEEKRGTAVFYEGWLDTSVSTLDLDLTVPYKLPTALKEGIEKKYITEIKGVTYSMYFSEFDFYERQQLFYSQMLALYGNEVGSVEQ